MWKKLNNDAEERSKYAKLLQNAVKLSEDPFCEQVIPRHIEILDELLKHSHDVLWVQHLSSIIRLLNSLYERCSRCVQYRQHFLDVLDLCFFPPMLNKSSDVLEYETDIRELLNMFGYILARTNIYEKYRRICKGLSRMFTMSNLPINCVSIRALNEILFRSRLPYILTELGHIVNDDFYLLLVNLIQNLLQNDDTCRLFIRLRLFELMVKRLDAEITCKEASLKMDAKAGVPAHFYQSIESLWRLSEVYLFSTTQFKNDCGIIVTGESWESFRTLFKRFVLSRAYKLERNCLMRFICVACTVFPAEHHATFNYDLILIALATEVGTPGTWAAEVVFTSDDDDFDFKIQMLSIFCYYNKWYLKSKSSVTNNVLLGTLRLLMPEIKLVWTESQRRKLMKNALIILGSIAIVMLQEFLDFGGPGRLLHVFETILQGTLSVNLLKPCLVCIHATLATKSSLDIAKKYRSKGALDLLIVYLKMVISQKTFTLQDQYKLIITFCILQHLNKNFECPKYEMIQICCQYITRYLQPSKRDCFLDPRVIIALLDFLWENIMHSAANKTLFLKSNGVYLLLDVIETFPNAVKLVALSVLIELTEDGSSLPFIATWRGKNRRTALSLFLHIFRLGNDRNDNVTEEGVIKDTELPLMGRKQLEMTYRRRKDLNSSPSSLSLLGSTQPKIYALLQMLQCRPITKLIYSEYNVHEFQLTKLDEVTMVLAQNYLPLKLGELWIEMSWDMKANGIRPLTCDKEIFCAHILYASRLSNAIKEMQLKVLQEQREKLMVQEQQLYQRLRDQVLSEALEALDEIRWYGRCVEPLYNILLKRTQKDQILRSRKLLESNGMCHQTFLSTGNATCVFNQYVTVRSNIVINPNEEKSLPPVSPTVSTDRQIKNTGSTRISYQSNNLSEFQP